MKRLRDILILLTIVLFSSVTVIAQEKDKTLLKAEKEAKTMVYTGNELLEENDFVSAEMEYRKAISEQPEIVAGTYNLGKSYYDRGDYSEALYRNQQALQHAKTKKEKHYAFHNIGNILMKEKKCKEAEEAFKNALKNDPTDDETRYNFVLAKKCAEEQQKQQEQNKDQQDKQEDNKDKEDKDKEGDQEKDQQDKNQEDKEGDKDKNKEGEEEDEEQKPDKKDQEKEGKQDQKKPPKQKPGQLSPQQVKNLLEAMNAQEQKVQEKINAEKQKGIKIKTEKDW